MTVQKQLYTLQQFEQFIAQPENRERIFELINGEIVEKGPTEEHGIIAGLIVTEFNLYLKTHPLGRAGVEVRHRIPEDEKNDYIPDVSFVSNERALAVTKKGAVPQMPDIAVEIRSPDDSTRKMREKALYYLKNGSRMAILVFPRKQQVEVHTEESVQTYNVDDTIDLSAVLPGFSLVVKDIFAQ